MKQTGWLLVWLALGGAGCLNTPAPGEGGKPNAAAQAAPLPPPAPPVMPDQVTDANAAEQARALRQELEHAGHEQSPPPPATARQ